MEFGRLRNTPESAIADPIIIPMRTIEKDAKTRSNDLLHFLIDRASKMDHPLQHRKEMRSE